MSDLDLTSSSDREAFCANAWFAALPRAAQDAMVEHSHRVPVKEGTMLYRVGDPTGTFYGLRSGLLKISSSRPDGKEAILSMLEPGLWFGEMSMVDKLPRTHDATAVVDSVVLAMRSDAFDRLMERPDFSSGIARLLATRMRLLFAVLEDSVLRPTLARVARRLVLLSHGDSTLASDSRRVVPVSQGQLAMMLGITRQTLAKELHVMIGAGALATRYGRVEIVSVERLQAFADDAQA